MSFDEIVSHGSTALSWEYPPKNFIRCADGYAFSACASFRHHSTPGIAEWHSGEITENYPGPYTHFEVLVFGGPEEDIHAWGASSGGIYGNVPEELVRELIAYHGGEAADS